MSKRLDAIRTELTLTPQRRAALEALLAKDG
jgi:hypothetical protein